MTDETIHIVAHAVDRLPQRDCNRIYRETRHAAQYFERQFRRVTPL